MAVAPRRSILIAYTAILGALAIIMSSIRVSFPLGNPNLGSTPVSLAAVTTPWSAGFIVGLIKGFGISLWTGQFLIEIPAGIGDGFVAILTNRLGRRIDPVLAVPIGQLFRYIFTSGMIALSLSISQTSGLAAFASYWIAMVPAITASIVVNAILSTALTLALKKFYPSILNQRK